MNSDSEIGSEATVAAVCAVCGLAVVLAWLACLGLGGGRIGKAETAPYSICESCGRVLDAGNAHETCVPEGSRRD